MVTPMETQDPEVIWKPQGPPDVITPAGHAFWWADMYFMHVFGGYFKLEIDQENSQIYFMNRAGQKVPIGPEGQTRYDKWLSEVFESKFLGDQDD